MAEHTPRVPLETGEIPITSTIPKVAEQYQELKSSPQDTEKKTKIPAQLKVLIFAALVIALGFGLIAPVLPRFAASYDVGAMAASAVVSMFALTRLIFAPAAGSAVNKIGERPTYIIGVIVVALGSFGTAFSWDYTSLMAFRALGGIGSVMFTVSAMGLLVQHSPAHLRGRISGYYATAFLLGNILGPVIGSLMAGLGMRLPFIIYGAVLLIAAVIVFFFLKAEQGAQGGSTGQKEQLSFKDALQFSNFKAALSTNFAIGWAALGIRVSIMPLAAVALLASYHSGENYDPEAGGTVLAGVAMATYAAGNAITQNISGSLSDKYGRRQLVFYGLLLAGISTILVSYSGSPLFFTVFSGLTGIGTGFLAPSLQASVADVIGNSRSGGQVLAIFQMANDVGQIVGPLLAGFIADRWGYGPAFGVSALILLVCMLGWLPWRKPKFPADLADSAYTGK